jgi:hypothetical protein
MQAGSSQAATATVGPPQVLPTKERKPRHKLKKGKEREGEGPTPSTHSDGAGHSKATLGKRSIAEEVSTWGWELLADASVSNRPPVFTNDYRCARCFIAV